MRKQSMLPAAMGLAKLVGLVIKFPISHLFSSQRRQQIAEMSLRGQSQTSQSSRVLCDWLLSAGWIYTDTNCFQETFKVAKQNQFHAGFVHLFWVCIWPRCEFCTKCCWCFMYWVKHVVLQLSLVLFEQRCVVVSHPFLCDKCDTLLFRGILVVFKNKFSSWSPLAMSGEPRCINLCLTGSGAETLHFVLPWGRVKFSPGVCWHRLWSQWTFPVISGHRWWALLPEATIPQLIKEGSDTAGSWSLPPKDWQE